jgi:monoamine oxidase
MRVEYESAYDVFWEKIPYSLGAFAAGRGAGDRLGVLGKPDNRIYLGCAAVSGNGAWMEGAVSAAWKQVTALHERVMVNDQTRQSA